MRRFHFLHIGKTGGNAVQHALRPYADSAELQIVLHPHETTLADIPPGELVGFGIREPVERFISGFNSRLRLGRPRHHIPWTPAEAEVFRRFTRARDLAAALTAPDRETRDSAIRAMSALRHLARGLPFWLASPEYLEERKRDIAWIAYTPTLCQDFARLKAILDLPGDCELPRDPVAAHIHPDTDDLSMDPAGARNLRLWYRLDYEIFEYCRGTQFPEASL